MKRAGIIIGVILVIVIFVVLIIKLPRTNPVIPEQGNNSGESKYSSELKNLLNTNIEHDKLIQIYYSDSGNMNGNVDKTTIDLINLTVKTEYKANYSDPLEVKVYSIEEEDLKDIVNYIERYNLVAWHTLPYDYDAIELDGGNKSFTLTYDNSKLNKDNKDYVISYNTKLPKEGYAILNELKQKINSLIVSTNLVSESIDETLQK